MDTNKLITPDTARKIWSCYKEMEHCKELIAAAAERLRQETEGRTSRDEPERKFHPIEMGIPYFSREGKDTSQRIYQLTTDLAVTVLDAHLKKQEEKLRKLMMLAQQELNGIVVVELTGLAP